MSDKLDLIQSFYDRVWVEGSPEAADAFFDPEVTANGLVADLAFGGPDFHAFVDALLALIEVRRVTLVQPVEQGEWISVLVHFEASVLASGREVDGSAMLLARIRNNRFLEAYNCLDTIGMFEKMGLLPENSAALCMAGHRLR
ncbi:nuclear transport factor 2 family protein [Tropicimonas sp. IMCC6043]|uniref:nuclear transport factor 2 family protein n=1 Tax=Tropicimonas sp. IMCC6043 TaxID=2510645 RepID=UPI00101D3FD3|nr:nuclear transport factor 2 family protein [Tropicimonas sp. IMCC6043]RYH10282.1 hypothetical protein EU800_08285 [Tropicimonas sp. IMCC6043]